MKNTIMTIIKYLFALVLIIYASFFYKSILYFIFGLTELLFIFFLSNFLLRKKRIIGLMVNDILILLLNINYIVLIFGGTYVSTIMLSNLSSIPTLGHKLIVYGISLLFVIALSVLPVKAYRIKKDYFIILLFAGIFATLLQFYKPSYSCYSSYFLLIKEYYDDYKMKQRIKNTHGDLAEFYNDGYSDNIIYKNTNKPNVILIFTEGLSMNIIEDSRNIMPKTKKYMEQSLRFDNYFNHTAATYRGLIGQLFSGYQYDNLDKNKLISLEDILRDNGYYTSFINTEYTNTEFNDYLNSLNFDSVVMNNTEGYMEDKDAYEFLYSEASRLNKEEQPFFLSIYTVQTHVGWNSDNKFRNGKNDLLNRFYNNDIQFGSFMNKFINSDLYDNTIIVYTTDHSTYTDNDFYKAFPNYNRSAELLDEIPLFIYQKDIKPDVIDVNGKNTLDLAPTILDYLDISADNYFLGNSLFSSISRNNYDYYYFYPGVCYSTFDSSIQGVADDDEIFNKIVKYISTAKN